jgi:hypothetical protein
LVKDTHRASPLSPGCLLVQGIKLFTQPSPRDRAFFATGLDAGDREPGRYCEADRGGFAARHAPVRVCQGGCPHAPCHAMPHVGCTGRERSRLAAAGGILEHRRGRASAHPAGRVRTPADPNNLCRGSRVRAVRHTEPSDRPSPPSPPLPQATDSALEALSVMDKNALNSVAIVETDGTLVGNISGSDLGLFLSGRHSLHIAVMDFFAQVCVPAATRLLPGLPTLPPFPCALGCHQLSQRTPPSLPHLQSDALRVGPWERRGARHSRARRTCQRRAALARRPSRARSTTPCRR